MESDWVEFRNCTWLQEAHFVESVLKAEGIEARAVDGSRVLVRADDKARANEALDAVTDPLDAVSDPVSDARGG